MNQCCILETNNDIVYQLYSNKRKKGNHAMYFLSFSKLVDIYPTIEESELTMERMQSAIDFRACIWCWLRIELHIGIWSHSVCSWDVFLIFLLAYLLSEKLSLKSVNLT